MDDGLFLGVMGLSRDVRDGVLGPVNGMEVGGVFADDVSEFGLHDFFCSRSLHLL